MSLLETAQLLGSFGEFFGFIGILISLLYLGRQIRIFSLQMEKEQEREHRDQFRIFVESEHLPRILSRILDAKQHGGHPGGIERRLSEQFELSLEDAVRWSRFMGRTWALIEQDFLDGKMEAASSSVIECLQTPEHPLWFETVIKNRQGQFADFVRVIAREV